MGAERSHNRNADFRLNLIVNQSFDNKYQAKLFLKNKKSTQKFKEQLLSICKRSSYLNYPWAKQLLNTLNASTEDKLYKQYKSVLKENCIRQGYKQKIFCPAKIRNHFMETFTYRYGRLNINLTPKQLQALYDECKAYHMVMTWLSKLVKLEQQKQDNAENEEQDWYYFEESIYQILVRITQSTYVNLFKKDTKFSAQKSIKTNDHPLNEQFRVMLAYLRKHKLSFSERESIIQKIQNELQSLSAELLRERSEQIQLYIDQPEIFSHLMVIREVGRISIDFLWQHFCQEDYRLLFA